MKRTPLKRTGWLARLTPLASTSQLARRTPLPRVSAKRARDNRTRRAVVSELWPDGRPTCIVPGCTKLADDVHEARSRARGGSITDPDEFCPLCRGHHDAVTFDDPDWAYELHILVHSWDRRTPAELAALRRDAIAAAELELIEQRGLESEWAGEA